MSKFPIHGVSDHHEQARAVAAAAAVSSRIMCRRLQSVMHSMYVCDSVCSSHLEMNE